jgi:hypothetical protein
MLLLAGECLLAAGGYIIWQRAKPAPDNAAVLDQLQNQLTLLEKTTAAGASGTFSTNLANISGQITALATQTGADHTALASLQANNASVANLQAQVAKVAALQHATLALNAGQPLGPLPGAPTTLTAFATTPPPTFAALVNSFPAAARAAAAASITGTDHPTLWSRFLAHLENFITISDGTHVIIGAPAAAALAQARASLAAGDLAGAVAALSTLSLSTQAAMGNWLPQARALLAAQHALLTLTSPP